MKRRFLQTSIVVAVCVARLSSAETSDSRCCEQGCGDQQTACYNSCPDCFYAPPEDECWYYSDACRARCDQSLDLCVAGCPSPDLGSFTTSYYVASVAYAPPGRSSYVNYGAGSATGTTTSSTSSWKQEVNESVDEDWRFTRFSAGVSLSFGNTFGGSTAYSKDFVLKNNSDWTVNGDGADTINHDYDQIYLFLGPAIHGRCTVSGVKWWMDASLAEPQIVLLGWLKGTLPFPPNVLAKLDSYGVTAADYLQLLSLDPFAYDPTGTSRPDPVRFAQVASYPYEAIADFFNYQTNNTYTTTTAQTATYAYSVKTTYSVGLLFTKLTHSDQFTWTSETKNTNTSATSDTETLRLTMPSPGYSGPTVVYAYVDKLYKTFMLSFVGPIGVPPSLSTVSPAWGRDSGGAQVTLTGSGFVAGATTVTFGGVSAPSVSVADAFTLTATTPAHVVGPVDVRVTVQGRGGSRPNGFTYYSPAQIMSVINTLLQ